MGSISLEKKDSLYWLGRYTERVATTLSIFNKYYDRMLDTDATAYINLCKQLDIPNIYENQDDFIHSFLFDSKNPDSILTSLNRSYDNGIILRDEISTETLAYIQMALDVFKASSHSDCPTMALIPVVDYLMAFWGSMDDNVVDQRCRNIIKCGRYVERLDLFYRLGYDDDSIYRTLCRLKYRLDSCNMEYRHNIMDGLYEYFQNDPIRPDNWRRVCAMSLMGLIIE